MAITTVEIEKNIPIPRVKRYRSEAGEMARAMVPGDSVLCRNDAEYSTVRKVLWQRGVKCVSREEGMGWRVWAK